ncbi:MAG: nitrate/nitrite transporter NrtS [Candidatus Polarisedimenticolia bacterium]
MTLRRRLELARSPVVVRRALKYAVIVGTVLIAINHGDAILHGTLDTGRLLRMGLTVMVPYIVSTLSSVEAMSRRDQG